MKTLFLLASLTVVVILTPSTSFAQTPSDVRDLVDVRASSGESELESRGYVHINSQPGADRTFSHWWKQSSHICIEVATMYGRYNSITTSPAFDCNQRESSENHSGVGAAVAVGAAAILIGAIASSSHRSHHHEDRSHSDDANYEREFERGHNDGLYNHSYDNNDSEAYHAGYESGVEQRSHNTSYRQHSGNQPSISSAGCPSDIRGNECEYYMDGYRAGAADGGMGMSMFYERHEEGYDSRFEPYFARGYEAGWRANR